MLLLLLQSVAGTFIAASQARAAEPAAKTVSLIVDYGDEVRLSFDALPWREGLTVMDAMNAAKDRKHGWAFKYRGSGEMALLLSIDGVDNQGGGNRDKNWVYRVNKKLGHESFGSRKLAAEDVVVWRFEVYDQ